MTDILIPQAELTRLESRLATLRRQRKAGVVSVLKSMAALREEIMRLELDRPKKSDVRSIPVEALAVPAFVVPADRTIVHAHTRRLHIPRFEQPGLFNGMGA